jgi:hypothetical protein
MNQKLEADKLKIVANNQGYQVKGDVRINGQAASLDYRKPNEGDADIKLQATLDDASRAKLGLDLGPAVSGSVPIKLNGKIGAPDRDSRMGIEADLVEARQYPAGLGQIARKIEPRRFQRGAEAAIDPARRHCHRRRRRIDQGIARGRSK